MHNHKPTLKSIFFPVLNKTKPSDSIYRCKLCGEKIMVKKNYRRMYNIIHYVIIYAMIALPIAITCCVKIANPAAWDLKYTILMIILYIPVLLSAHIILNMCVPFEVYKDDEENKVDNPE